MQVAPTAALLHEKACIHRVEPKNGEIRGFYINHASNFVS